jgi:hypothetical protein
MKEKKINKLLENYNQRMMKLKNWKNKLKVIKKIKFNNRTHAIQKDPINKWQN